jgi:hypothetical protein
MILCGKCRPAAPGLYLPQLSRIHQLIAVDWSSPNVRNDINSRDHFAEDFQFQCGIG